MGEVEDEADEEDVDGMERSSNINSNTRSDSAARRAGDAETAAISSIMVVNMTWKASIRDTFVSTQSLSHSSSSLFSAWSVWRPP